MKPQTKSVSSGSTSTSAETKHTRHWIPLTAVIGGVVVLVLVGLTSYAYVSQARTIVHGSRVAGQDVGGLTTLQALQRVEQQWTAFSAGAFRFQLNGQDITTPVSGASPSQDEIVIDLAWLNIPTAVDEAYDYGHTGPWWLQAKQRLSGWIGRHHDFGTLGIDKETLAATLHKQTVESNSDPVNAGVVVKNGEIVDITPSADGRAINYGQAIAQAVTHAQHLDTSPIALTVDVTHPSVPDASNLMAIAQAQLPSLLDRAPFKLTYGNDTWTMSRTKLQTLIGFDLHGDGHVQLGFDAGKTSEYLSSIAKSIDVDPRNAKLTIANGQVSEFQTSVVGHVLNIDQSFQAMEQTLIDQTQNTVALIVDDIQPATSTLTANNLGITELVAEATTDFKGSPTNRKYNIGLGARLLNGLLIAPGETFSLVSALGPIDQKHGWKSELVILGSKITPEYGGGLCQVATTLFRAAMNTGLPIVERSNHSLRISYYEPPIGLDATIYVPKPDLRFTNDYNHYLLLQTEIVGTKITFRFYGTKDDRTVDIPTPKVYNKTAIPATKTIEVTDLKPGEKQCQTPGHPGADAVATYTVTKSDGAKVTQTFKSHYRAIGVICRVGKKVTPTPSTNTNTSTDTNTSTAPTNTDATQPTDTNTTVVTQ